MLFIRIIWHSIFYIHIQKEVKDMASAILILTLIMSLLINITRVDELIGPKQNDDVFIGHDEIGKVPTLETPEVSVVKK